jgi:hypothetical protein
MQRLHVHECNSKLGCSLHELKPDLHQTSELPSVGFRWHEYNDCMYYRVGPSSLIDGLHLQDLTRLTKFTRSDKH